MFRSVAVSTEVDDRFMIDNLHAMLPDMQFVYEPAMIFADGDHIGNINDGILSVLN